MLILALLVSAAPAAAQGPPEFENISVSPNPFTPNGDGVNDRATIDYTLTEDADWVTVEVRDSVSALVRVLLNGIPQPAGEHSLVWDGRDATSSVAADGGYSVRFAAGNDFGQAREEQRLLRLDATTPLARIIEVFPTPFTPAIPLSPDSLLIRVEVGNSSVDDSLTVVVSGEEGAQEDTLRVTPSFSGDGTYSAYWKNQAAGEGRYEIDVSISDRAGNRGVDRSNVYLDKNPPLVGITYPEDQGVFLEVPDSVRGAAYDPNGVLSVEISYDSRPFNPVPATVAGDTVLWAAPLRDSVPEQGDHTVEARATDGPGHVGSAGDLGGPSDISLELDTVAPGVPVLGPLPPLVRKADLVVSGKSSGADSVEIYLNDLEGPFEVVSAGFSGGFSSTVPLRPGDNVIAAAGLDAAGNRSSLSPPAHVELRREFGIFFNERFRPGDRFEINLAEPARGVEVHVYSTAGRLVRVLGASGPSTSFEVAWDGADGSGSAAGNGVYLVRVEAKLQDGSVISDKKLVALVR